MSLIVAGMIVYIEDTKYYTKTCIELITKFSNLAGYKINNEKSITLHTQTKNSLRENLVKQHTSKYHPK